MTQQCLLFSKQCFSPSIQTICLFKVRRQCEINSCFSYLVSTTIFNVHIVLVQTHFTSFLEKPSTSSSQLKEMKNGLISSWASALTSLNFFRTISEEHLTMGHTHEDLDAFFGMLSRFVKDSDDNMYCWPASFHLCFQSSSHTQVFYFEKQFVIDLSV